METNNKRRIITNLSDADFLTFLYAERNRENSISQYPGWSNWALFGALATALCSAISVQKNSDSIDFVRVFYYVGGIIALFLSCRAYYFLLKRRRGTDDTKVRTYWNVVPGTLIIFIILFSAAEMYFIFHFDHINVAFWLWTLVISILLLTSLVIFIFRNKVVPSSSTGILFVNSTLNIGVNALLGGLYGAIFEHSFKSASWAIFNPSFEFAIFISAAILAFFILIKFNVENKVVREFDMIVDAYIYTGASREDTYRAIVRNRMGYGVLDVCAKEVKQLQRALEKCIEEDKEAEEAKKHLNTKECDINQLSVYLQRMKKQLVNLQALLDRSRRLSERMNEAIAVSDALRSVEEVEMIFEVNGNIYQQAVAMTEKVGAVSDLIQDKIDQYAVSPECSNDVGAQN